MTTKIECPSCQQHIEIEMPAPFGEAARLRARARRLEFLAWLGFVLGLTGLGAQFFMVLLNRDDFSPVALPAFGALCLLALLAAFFAQLLHLRANTEK